MSEETTVVSPEGVSMTAKTDLAERAHWGEFGEAPFGLEPVPGQDQDDRLCTLHLAVERALPIAPGGMPACLSKIEERLLESDRGEPCLDLCRLCLVAAGMRNEDARHRSCP